VGNSHAAFLGECGAVTLQSQPTSWKLSCPVLRGGESGDARTLPDDFLGWHFKVQKNGKFRSIPSKENFKALRKKVKHIVNNSNYGATLKAKKLAPVVRGWRNYHKYCVRFV
jgi:spermidine/putrescine-binding protein